MDLDKSKINTFKEPVVIAVFLYTIFVIGIFVANFIFGLKAFPFLSSKIGEWTDFSSYVANLINPLIAIYLLYFVIKTFRLQKTELAKTTEILRNQIDTDGLLRRQESLICLINKYTELLLKKLEAETRIDKDEKYEDLFDAVTMFNITNESVTLHKLLNLAASNSYRGDYNNTKLDLPGDFYALKNIIRQIDIMCVEISIIDTRLSSNSDVFKSSLSMSVIMSTSAEIEPTVDKLRKLKHFDTINTDYLNHF